MPRPRAGGGGRKTETVHAPRVHSLSVAQATPEAQGRPRSRIGRHTLGMAVPTSPQLPRVGEPRRCRRRLPLLVLCLASAVFAEVPSMSAPLALVTPWGLLVVLPLYGLHTVVLAALAFRLRRPVSLPLLWALGGVLGLYEAYLTKVIWDPTWSTVELPWRAGGLAVAQTAVLVLFWHPLMSFVVPLAVTERVLGTAGPVAEVTNGLPGWTRRLRRRWWLPPALLGAGCGLYQTAAGGTPGLALLSLLAGLGPIGLAAFLARRRSGPSGLRALLPQGRGLAWAAAALGVLYLVMTPTVRSDSLPRTLLPHALVWCLYAALAAAAVGAARAPRSARRGTATSESASESASESTPRTDRPARWLLVLAATWLAAAALGALLPALAAGFVALAALSGVSGGLLLVIRGLMRRPS